MELLYFWTSYTTEFEARFVSLGVAVLCIYI